MTIMTTRSEWALSSESDHRANKSLSESVVFPCANICTVICIIMILLITGRFVAKGTREEEEDVT